MFDEVGNEFRGVEVKSLSDFLETIDPLAVVYGVYRRTQLAGHSAGPQEFGHGRDEILLLRSSFVLHRS